MTGGCLDGSSVEVAYDSLTQLWKGEGPAVCGGWLVVEVTCGDDGLGGVGLSYGILLFESESSPGVDDACWGLSGLMAVASTDPLDATEANVNYQATAGCQPSGCACDSNDLATVSATE